MNDAGPWGTINKAENELSRESEGQGKCAKGQACQGLVLLPLEKWMVSSFHRVRDWERGNVMFNTRGSKYSQCLLPGLAEFSTMGIESLVTSAYLSHSRHLRHGSQTIFTCGLATGHGRDIRLGGRSRNIQEGVTVASATM